MEKPFSTIQVHNDQSDGLVQDYDEAIFNA